MCQTFVEVRRQPFAIMCPRYRTAVHIAWLAKAGLAGVELEAACATTCCSSAPQLTCVMVALGLSDSRIDVNLGKVDSVVSPVLHFVCGGCWEANGLSIDRGGAFKHQLSD